jgi:hypothetical protein
MCPVRSVTYVSGRSVDFQSESLRKFLVIDTVELWGCTGAARVAYSMFPFLGEAQGVKPKSPPETFSFAESGRFPSNLIKVFIS